MSERLAALLEGLLEPLVEERLSAAEALALLAGNAALAPGRCARPLAPGLFLSISFLLLSLYHKTVLWAQCSEQQCDAGRMKVVACFHGSCIICMYPCMFVALPVDRVQGVCNVLSYACRGERQLPGARAKVTVTGSVLEVAVPRAPLLSGDNAGMASFALVWNGTIAGMRRRLSAWEFMLILVRERSFG